MRGWSPGCSPQIYALLRSFSLALTSNFSLPTSRPRHPLSLTYGVNLPSSLTMLLPIVLGFSPHPPVSVYGTGTFTLDSGFSRQCGISYFGTLISLLIRSSKHPADFPTGLSISLERALPAARLTYPPASPLLYLTNNGSTGISTCCPSPTPFGLSLGPDLPWEDEPSPGNLRFSTVKILTLLSLLIPAFSLLLRPHVLTIVLHPTTISSPTTYVFHTHKSIASVHSLSPGNFRRRLTRLVSYYALFK